MTYYIWKNWLREIPLTKKWFVILLLFRPIIDSFYQLKEVSPLSSPLYIVGILTPIIIAVSFLTGHPRRPNLGSISFTIFSVSVFINCILFFANYATLQMFGNLLKYSTPIFLFFYLKAFFKHKKDIDGILFTFLISSIIPLIILLYELIISPISPESLSISRGGGSRYRGFYADSFSYAIYITGSVFSAFYLFLNKTKKDSKDLYLMAGVFFIAIIGLISIKHTASWVVFSSLVILFFIVQLKSFKGILIGSLFFLIVLPLVGQYVYETQINPLIAKEFYVLEGDAPIERSFNGRMTRWINYFNWWEEMDVFSKFLGISNSGHPKAPIMIGGNAHNDFIRLFFLSGLPGLISYLVFLFNILIIGLKQKPADAFLIIGSFLMVFLFSITAMPTLYVSLLYLIVPVFIYAIRLKYDTANLSFKTQSDDSRKVTPPIHGPGYSHRNNNKFPFKRRF